VKSVPIYHRLRVLLPVALLLLAALAAFAWADNATYRGITYAPPPQPIPWADQRLGVNAFNIQFEPDPAVVKRTFEAARDMGAHYVRIQMPWEDIEQSGKGDFWDHKFNQSAWDKYDTIVDLAQEVGVELIVRIDRPPRWARAIADATPAFQAGLRENGNSTGPPEDYRDYADFVGAVAERYRGKLRFFQVWNEPNLSYEWNWVLPEPERFVELLGLAYTAIKQANPDAVVLFPSLSPTDGLEPRIAPLSELEYLDRVYKAGGGAYFDIMSAQAYGLGQPPDEHRYVFLRNRGNWNWGRPIDTRIDVSRLVLLREVMERNGDSETAVWVSEFGYVVDSPTIPPERRLSWGEPVSELQQAEYLVGQIERARREWPWLGVMNLWFLRWGGYQEPNPDDPTQFFAVMSRDFEPLPAYTALQNYVANAPAGVGAHTWEHPSVRSLPDGSWQIRFEGTSLALWRMAAPLTVAIDGAAPRTVAPSPDSDTVTIAEGLADGVHTAVVQGDAPPGAFVVGRTPPMPWLWASIPAVLVAALMLVGALLMRRLVWKISGADR
jgi:hypothetical protein